MIDSFFRVAGVLHEALKEDVHPNRSVHALFNLRCASEQWKFGGYHLEHTLRASNEDLATAREEFHAVITSFPGVEVFTTDVNAYEKFCAEAMLDEP